MKTIIFSVIAGFVFVAGLMALQPQDVSACSYIFRTPQEMFQTADVVFRGTVTARATTTKATESVDFPLIISTTHFDVSTYWKGVPSNKVIVESAALANFSCTPFVSTGVGAEYIVYGYATSTPNLYIVGQVDAKPVTYAAADLAFLGSGTKPQVTVVVTPKPDPKPDSTPVTPVTPLVPMPDPVPPVLVDADVEVSFMQKIKIWFANFFK